ncbi:hypothetical protein DCS_08228 [Drechmeria coniospora]|uniref:Uncharacterized protein n=1 Tax=Drechmeria coniospora TaxID=98403 RepID=A0A151GGM8_DRECN|nr:hypothetical protein DCS_08228 [Drechmeria coniospora]KYK56258.1 hypothetical protein DCS_08228 [Drechmeria coniospora]
MAKLQSCLVLLHALLCLAWGLDDSAIARRIRNDSSAHKEVPRTRSLQRRDVIIHAAPGDSELLKGYLHDAIRDSEDVMSNMISHLELIIDMFNEHGDLKQDKRTEESRTWDENNAYLTFKCEFNAAWNNEPGSFPPMDIVLSEKTVFSDRDPWGRNYQQASQSSAPGYFLFRRDMARNDGVWIYHDALCASLDAPNWGIPRYENLMAYVVGSIHDAERPLRETMVFCDNHVLDWAAADSRGDAGDRTSYRDLHVPIGGAMASRTSGSALRLMSTIDPNKQANYLGDFFLTTFIREAAMAQAFCGIGNTLGIQSCDFGTTKNLACLQMLSGGIVRHDKEHLVRFRESMDFPSARDAHAFAMYAMAVYANAMNRTQMALLLSEVEQVAANVIVASARHGYEMLGTMLVDHSDACKKAGWNRIIRSCASSAYCEQVLNSMGHSVPAILLSGTREGEAGSRDLITAGTSRHQGRNDCLLVLGIEKR